MKKALVSIAGLILLVSLVGYSKEDKQNFYGIYTFEKVEYLSPLSSSTVDYVEEQMAGAEYTIEADLFKIESNNKYNRVEISSPNYVREKIPNRSIISNKVESQYNIDTTHRRLYVSSDSLWIASYVDNTADGLGIIMDIYKLSKIH